MAAVFGCFLLADVLELKEFGLALALAVILDATLVRLLLVPAIMKFAGKANWWLPGFLERHLPRIRIDWARRCSAPGRCHARLPCWSAGPLRGRPGCTSVATPVAGAGSTNSVNLISGVSGRL